jgi:hypothetical protein
MWRDTLIGTAALLLCGGANAQTVFEQTETGNLAKFIKGFNAVTVRIQPESDRCGIRDGAHFADKVKQELVSAGLKENPDALTSAYLFIWAKAFGPLGQQCAVFSSLRLGRDVSAAAAEFKVQQDEDNTLIEQVRTVRGTFPAAFYLTSKLDVRIEPTAAAEQDKIVEALVADFKAARGTASGSQ